MKSFAMPVRVLVATGEIEDPKTAVKGILKANRWAKYQKCRENRLEVAPKTDRSSDHKALGQVEPLRRMRDNPKMKAIVMRSEVQNRERDPADKDEWTRHDGPEVSEQPMRTIGLHVKEVGFVHQHSHS